MQAFSSAMPLHPDGYWVPTLAPKGMQAFNTYGLYTLYTGSRLSTKTVTACHRLCRHLWECRCPRIAIINKTIKGAKAAGVWTDLTEIVLPEWLNAGIGMKWITEPKTTSDTKMTFFEVSNREGKKAEVQLHSLEKASEVMKFKGHRYSCFYFPELDQFDTGLEDRVIFTVTRHQLRMIGLDRKEHMWLADTNPPPDRRRSWMWQVFFGDALDEKGKLDEELLKERTVIKFTPDDNIWMPTDEKERLRQSFAYDKQLYARWWDGEWIEDVGGSLFQDVFRPPFHVVGNCDSLDQSKWEQIVPDEHTFEIPVGWDPGDITAAVVFIQKREAENRSVFEVIDELTVNGAYSLWDFSQEVEERMAFWTTFCRQEYKREHLLWRHWSDTSALRWKAGIQGDEALVVRNATMGRVVLLPASKPPVKDRVKLLRKLLFENRLFVSANCRAVVEMLHYIKSGSSGQPVDPKSPHRHVFDALTYALARESPMDLEIRYEPAIARPSGIVTVEGR